MPIVVMDPALKHGFALRRMVVGNAVGPFAKRRLDKALGLPVGLRSVRSCEAVSDAQTLTGAGKRARVECCAIIGEHTAYAHPEGAEVSDGVLQELRSAGLALVGIQIGESDTRMVIDGHE